MADLRITNYKDYREYLTSLISTYPKKGYGLLGKLATAVQVQSSFLSQIFSGTRELSLEQGLAVAEFFDLAALEQKYFLMLIQSARAGTPKLKAFLEVERLAIASQFDRVQTRVKPSRTLSEADQALYYSDDAYIAVWLMTGIKGYQTPSAIARKSGLLLKRVADILDFVVRLGLCTEENGRFIQAVTHTHIPENSRWIRNHHKNWRLRAIEGLQRLGAEDLAFSAPLTISRRDIPRVREELLATIERVSAIVKDSPSEELSCLNLDFFRVYP